MGMDGYLMGSIAKRKTAFLGHIWRGSSGEDFVTILEGCVKGIRSRGAQRNGQMTSKIDVASTSIID